jgi:hypothetical protein
MTDFTFNLKLFLKETTKNIIVHFFYDENFSSKIFLETFSNSISYHLNKDFDLSLEKFEHFHLLSYRYIYKEDKYITYIKSSFIGKSKVGLCWNLTHDGNLSVAYVYDWCKKNITGQYNFRIYFDQKPNITELKTIISFQNKEDLVLFKLLYL